MTRANVLLCSVLSLALLAALGGTALTANDPPAAAPAPQTIVINITSGPSDLFAVTTGLRMAADARLLNRRVIVLFSGAGARVPVRSLPHELRLNHEPSLREMLFELKDAGVEFIVCDFSVRGLGIYDAEFMDGTFIAHTNEVVLRRMGTHAVVFTY